MNELGPNQQMTTGMSLSKYNPSTTIFHYGSAIRTESYKIREFKNSRHVA